MSKINDQTIKRLEKALEVRKALVNLGINDNICPDLKPFFMILNNWVKVGEFKQGII